MRFSPSANSISLSPVSSSRPASLRTRSPSMSKVAISVPVTQIGIDQPRQRFQCQQISMRAEAADDTFRDRRHIGMVAESFTPEDIGQVDLDHRKLRYRKRVHDGDGGMGIGTRIQDDAVMLAPRLLNPRNQLAFQIGLAEVDRDVQGFRPFEAQ